jgi:DNA mismatch repair protein MutS2
MMLLIPKDAHEKLEFDKVLQLLGDKCLGELGRVAALEIRPFTDLTLIETCLDEAAQYKATIERGERFPIGVYHDVEEYVRHLEIEGAVLSVEGLRHIHRLLRMQRDILLFFTEQRRESYPRLYAIVEGLVFDAALIDAIDKVIDEEGNIRPDASPELLRLRRAVAAKQRELERVFRALIQEYRLKGWLSENVESFRNGRRVFSVPSEHKRKIRGIIHDESATGRTAFIEPEPVIEINNDIFDLEQEERREIYRILKELSARMRPHAPQLRRYQQLLTRYDLIQAKAALALEMNARRPRLVDRPHLGIIQGFHPLLYLKNKPLGKNTVPFQLTLHRPNRIVILSGPNAGGKSITMKSVGLLQLMAQSGLLVPVDAASEIGIFKKLFADIGDQQSIEDDLSTYSSRLRNMRDFLENADRHTLALIDEFGAGTDPKIGGAIAESILEALNKSRVYGLITTHYSNLKIFAFKAKGLVNASMTFDRDTLSPTYEFKVGQPGSSYGFEIAQKSGLTPQVLDYARRRAGKNERAVDELLIELQSDKQELEEKLENLRERERQLEKLIRNYELLHRELEVRRMKLKLETKEQALQQRAKENRDLEQLVREIREHRNLEKAQQLAAQAREERQKLGADVQALRETVFHQPGKQEKEIGVGDFVRLRSGGATGSVEQIAKDRAVVLMGDMRLTVPLRDLQHAKEPLDIRANRGPLTDAIDRNAAFQPKLDIRGMRLEEALKTVEDFVDHALMAGAANLRIVHGKGNGVLRNAVRAKLKEYNVDMELYHPEPEMGGDGVTLIEIK